MIMPQKPVVHVVFNTSAAGSLRWSLAHMGLNATVIGLPDDLSFGPIDPPAADIRARWMEDILGFERQPDLEQETDLFWSRATGRDIAPVVWVCRQSAMEFAGFLEFVSRIGDHPFRVVDITEVEFTRRSDGSESTTWRAGSFGQVPSDSIIRARLLERQTTLTGRELQVYRDLWKRLRAENAAFRVAADLGLHSEPIRYFDKAVTSHVTDDWEKCSLVVAKILVALWDDGLHCGDLVLWSRVRALADEGVFEMKGDGVRMRNSSVRLASGTG
ncbi:DUF3658 domain-containing protein [Mesorhizobium abyssinicae]|uniref:DUF3658 domain-containing protein n=1 Tax=Mesorhizobium abyssinicae TaxID=1209958 RepID=UPI002A23B308|nr:DUF3658 domain-containing protein [Mesorhizobium abyssinicae]MDX8434450.1 DUF3658 domain-containing protein [Mesorhizobium abyssinicae]